MNNDNDSILINEIINEIGKYNSKNNEACKKICSKIVQNIQNGVIPNNQLVIVFLNYIQKEHQQGNYSWNKQPSYLNDIQTKNIVLECLKIMSPYFDLSNLDIKNLINTLITKHNTSFLIQIMSEQKENISRHVLEQVIKSNFNDTCKEILKYYPNMFDSAILKCVIQQGNKELIIELLNMKIPFDDTAFEELLKKNMPESLEIFKLFLLNGLKISVKLLELACYYCSKDIINFLLSNKIEPNNKCLENIINSNCYKNYGYIRGRKVDNNDIKTELISNLIAYGYILTYKDLLSATKNKIYIKNVDQYNLKFDEKFLETCAEVGYYPDYKIKNIKPNSVCLEKECSRSGNIQEIKKLISMGITPTSKSLENSCSHKNNLASVRFLVEKGAKTNLQCIKNLAKTIGNRTLDYLLVEYEKQLEEEKKKLSQIKSIKKSKDYQIDSDSDSDSDSESESIQDENIPIISEHEDDVLEDDFSDSSSDSEDMDIDELSDPEIETLSDEKIKISKPGLNKKSKEIIVKGKKLKEKESSTKSIDSVKSNKSAKSDKSTKSNKSNEGNKSKKTNETKNETKNEPVKITINPPKKQIEQRVKVKISESVLKLFSLKKDEKISFLDLRRKFLEYFNKNSLYNEKNKLLIKVDNKMATALKLEENKYLHFDDLDNLIYQILDN